MRPRARKGCLLSSGAAAHETRLVHDMAHGIDHEIGLVEVDPMAAVLRDDVARIF